jgi:hypothetical protein
MINNFKIIEDLGLINKKHFVIVQCPKCSSHTQKRLDCLKNYKSCGCEQNVFLAPKRLRQIFIKMKWRCYNKNDAAYKNYGGRGIKICQAWLDDRKLFYIWAFENGYNQELTIDRIDNNEGYSPENCRWTTKKIQSRNTRKTVAEEIVKQIRSEPKNSPIKDLCLKYGIKYSCLKAIRSYQNWKDI